jgi:hypothetical protein
MTQTRYRLPSRGKANPRNLRLVGENESPAEGARRAYSKVSSSKIELTRILSSPRLPVMPRMAVLVVAQQRNVETMMEVNKVAFDAARAIIFRNLEFGWRTMTDMTGAVRWLSILETPGDRAVSQAETAVKIGQAATANIEFAGEVIQRANLDTMEMVNSRLMAAVEEAKGLFELRAARA